MPHIHTLGQVVRRSDITHRMIAQYAAFAISVVMESDGPFQQQFIGSLGAIFLLLRAFHMVRLPLATGQGQRETEPAGTRN